MFTRQPTTSMLSIGRRNLHKNRRRVFDDIEVVHTKGPVVPFVRRMKEEYGSEVRFSK